uniref:(northern house mosquito) hypothetical protein n=1 Tax=Culex pipiens TaxID=7175 RepID=A0A8D8I8L3_CULPI
MSRSSPSRSQMTLRCPRRHPSAARSDPSGGPDFRRPPPTAAPERRCPPGTGDPPALPQSWKPPRRPYPHLSGGRPQRRSPRSPRRSSPANTAPCAPFSVCNFLRLEASNLTHIARGLPGLGNPLDKISLFAKI